MQYRYSGSNTIVMVVEDSLTTINTGDVVELSHAPSSEFQPIKPKKVVKNKVVKEKKTAPKKTKSTEVSNASQTETSKLG